MNEISGIFNEIENAIQRHLFVGVRVGALMSVMPGFGQQSLPVRVKATLTIIVTLAVAPVVNNIQVDAETYRVLVAIFSEAAVGLILGLGLRILVASLQTAGAIAANATSLAQLQPSLDAEPLPALGTMLQYSGIAIAFSLGLHVAFVRLIVLSYELFPMGEIPGSQDVSEWGGYLASRAFAASLSLAMPFVVISIMYSVTIGFISKAMPGLMVAFIGAPVISLAALLLLYAMAVSMIEVWHAGFAAFLQNPLEMGR